MQSNSSVFWLEEIVRTFLVGFSLDCSRTTCIIYGARKSSSQMTNVQVFFQVRLWLGLQGNGLHQGGSVQKKKPFCYRIKRES